MRFIGKLFLFFIFGSFLFGADYIYDEGIMDFSASKTSWPASGKVCTHYDGRLNPASKYLVRVASDGEISAKVTSGDYISYYFQKDGHPEKIEDSIRVKAGDELSIIFKSTLGKNSCRTWFGDQRTSYKATVNFTPAVSEGACERITINDPGLQSNNDNAVHFGKLIDGKKITQFSTTITTKNAIGNHYLEVKADEDGVINLSSRQNKMRYFISSTNGNCGQNGDLGRQTYKIKKGQSVFIGIKTPINTTDALDINFVPKDTPFNGEEGKCERITISDPQIQTNNDNSIHFGKSIDGKKITKFSPTVTTKNTIGNHYLEVKADEDGVINLSSHQGKMRYFISSTSENCAQNGDFGKDTYGIKRGESVFIGIKTPVNSTDTLDINFTPGGDKCTNGNDISNNNLSIVYNFKNMTKAEIKTYEHFISIKDKFHNRVFYKYTVPKNGRLFIELRNKNSKDEKINLIRIDDNSLIPNNQTCAPNIFLASGENQFIGIDNAMPGKTYWVVVDTLSNYNTNSKLPYVLNATFIPEGVHNIPAPIYPEEFQGNSGEDKYSKPLPPISGRIPKGDGKENLGDYFNIYEDQNFYLTYGGAGSYVNGDMLSIGNSVVDSRGARYLYDGDFEYIKEDNNVAGYYQNSSRAILQLPDNLKGNNVKIKWARLYWQGYISKKNTYERDDVAKLIRGYRNINFKTGNDLYKQLSADSVNLIGSNNVFNNRKCTYADQGLTFHYSASTDVTAIIKRYIEVSDKSEFSFIGGNIATSKGQDDGICNNRLGEDNVQRDRLGRYGGWSLIVVYDVKENVKDSRGDQYFKPKQVSVYNGYKLLIPEFDYASTPNININLDGFYTPNSDEINAKITFLAFAGERGLASNDPRRRIDEGLYIWDAKKDIMHSFGKNAFQSSIFFQGSDGEYYDRDGSNGSKIIGLNLNGTNGSNKFYSGMDLQVYQVGKFMGKKQTSTTMKLAIPGQSMQGGTAAVDQSFVGMMGFSTDLYVPDLCYDDQVYNTQGWIGFFDNQKGGIRRSTPLDTTKPINDGSVVAGEQLFYRLQFKNRGPEDAIGVFVTSNLGNYNTYTTNSTQIDNELKISNIKDANFVYLKDGEIGAYSDPKRKIEHKINNLVYNDRQLTSLENNTLRFYIGKDAGIIAQNSKTPSGGKIRAGSVDNVFVEYNATVGQYYRYVSPIYTAGFSVSDPTGTAILASFDYNTPLKRCTDKKPNISVVLLNGLKVVNQNYENKNKKLLHKDERLYSQIAGKPFDAQLIYKPDFSGLFECLEKDKDGKCIKFNIPEDAKEFFGEDGLVKIGLQKFGLSGNLYLSLIRAQDIGACKWLGHSDKLPFVVNGKRIPHDYKVNLQDKEMINIERIEMEDAFRGTTFMLSYYPTGLESQYAGESGSGTHASYDEQFNGLTDEERKKIKEEIAKATAIFGTGQSADGSFHVCASDQFVTRPAYFQADMTKFDKYAKLINPNKSGDITKHTTISSSNILRVGGRYSDNIDIMTKTITPVSIKGYGVPNYNATIGGDLGVSGFSIRTGYEDSKDSDKRTVDIKTYLRPFISNACKANISAGTFYHNRNTTSTTLLVLNENKPYNYETNIKNSNYGQTICSEAEKKEYKGKCFDGANWRIWDKDKISLTGHFDTKKVELKDGVAKRIIWDADELRSEAIKSPSNKTKLPGVLTTGNLLDSGGNLVGAIFNYFNVGDVMVNLLDNTWTSNYGDQLWFEDYKSASCILNSTSNEHDENGMVGCDIGMKNDQNIVLRYQPDRVEIAMSGFSNADNIKNINNTDVVRYTYYNNPTPAQINKNDRDVTQFNKALIGDLRNLAKIEFMATAYLANDTYKDVVATLFDGTLMEGTAGAINYEVPRCGFSSDIDVGLRLDFDCSVATKDARCSSKSASRTSETIEYIPFTDKPGFILDIPSGTPFLKEEDCFGALYDSRCFKYDTKWISNGTEYQANRGGTQANQLPLPLNLAINFYSSASSNQIHNKKRIENPKDNTKEIMYDPKHPIYTLLKQGFSQGINSGAIAYFNFDRSDKNPNRPLIILGDDINIANTTLDRRLSIPSFDKDYDLINTTDTKLGDSPKFSGKPNISVQNSTEPSIKLNNLNLRQFLERAYPGETIDQNFIAQRGFLVNFVYGVINYNIIGGIAEGNIKGVPVQIPSAIFCGTNDSCKNLPFGIERTIFNVLDGSNSAGWVNNIFDIYNADSIRTNFVNEYQPQDNQVLTSRSNTTSEPRGIENVRFGRSEAIDGVEIRVFTSPWFIYTPNTSEILLGRDSIGSNNLYNYFNVNFVDFGTWGGEGQIKDSKKGDVGQFIGGKDLNASSRDKTLYNNNMRQNMRIDW